MRLAASRPAIRTSRPDHLISELEHSLRFEHGLRTLLQRRALVGGELDLDDLLETLATELAWHAEEVAAHAKFTLEERRARQDALLVVHDRLDHLHRTGGRRVVRRPGLEVLHD